MCRLLVKSILCCFTSAALLYAAPLFSLTLDLNQADLPQTIKLLAHLSHLNVLLSPEVSGVVTLHLGDATPDDALQAILFSSHLSQQAFGHVWLIAPDAMLAKETAQRVRLQERAAQLLPLTIKMIPIQYGQAETIVKLLSRHRLHILSKRSSLYADRRMNLVIVYALSQEIPTIVKLIHALDRPVKQIRIQARIVSIERDFESMLGITFSHRPNTGFILLRQATGLDLKLRALERAGHAHLIASPNLFTVDQQKASIEAGEEVPYQEVSQFGATAAVFKKAVLGFQVTPHSLPNHQVLLDMHISQDRPGARLVQGVPTISTRQITTSAVLKDHETLMLGGIYETDDESSSETIPVINRIPLIGRLLGEKSKHYRKRELLIFVTPHINN